MDVVVEIVTYWLSKEQRAGEDLCEGGRINLRRKNEEEDKQKAGRKKRRKMGKEENLVGRLIRWGRGRRFFFIEKKKQRGTK